MKRLHLTGLVCVFLLALLIRIIYLDKAPNGLHVDELDAGYIGTYILTHGQDINGNTLPLYFNNFGDYRPTGIFYLTGLAIKLLGNSVTAVRLPAALLGALTVVPIYFLAFQLFGSTSAIASAAILAFLPWHIVLSRATSEGIIGLFFVTTGLAYLIHGITTQKNKAIIVGVLIAAASYLFYHPFRILTPVILLPLVWHPRQNPSTKRIITAAIVGLCIITAILSTTGAGSGRFAQVALWKNPELKGKSAALIAAEGPQKIFQARVFHNKIIILTRELMSQYIRYFSPEFLFIKGGLPSRYAVPEQGLLLYPLGVLLFAGMVALLKQKQNWVSIYVAVLFFVSPVAAAITYEDTPNVHRSLLMILPFVLTAGAGLAMLTKIKLGVFLKTVGIVVLAFLYISEFIFFSHEYLIHARSHQPYYRNDTYLPLMDHIALVKNKYDRIYLPGYEHMPLYWLFRQNTYEKRQFASNISDVMLESAGSVIFMHTWCPGGDLTKLDLNKSVLVIEDGQCPKPEMLKETNIFTRTDATVAFRTYTNQQ